MAIPKANFGNSTATGPGYPRDDHRHGSMATESHQVGGSDCEQGNSFDTPLREERFTSNLEAKARSEAYKLNIKRASEINPKDTEWLFPDYLAKGELTLLAGPPSTGKTFIACYFAAAITQETPLPYNNCLPNSGTGNVLYISTEDSDSGNLIQRIKACGADLNHIHFIDPYELSADKRPFLFSDIKSINSLKQMNIVLEGTLNLIVIDPIYIAAGKDFKNAAKSRLAFENLSNLAKELNCAILGLAHTVKSPKGKGALERITSPTSLQEVPRSILVTSEIKSRPTVDGGHFVLVRAKSSNSEAGGGFEYAIRATSFNGEHPDSHARFNIQKMLSGYADDILKSVERDEEAKVIRKQDIAKDILTKHLADGQVVLGSELIQISEAMGISENTLKIAKRELGVDSRKRQGDGRSEWFFPT